MWTLLLVVVNQAGYIVITRLATLANVNAAAAGTTPAGLTTYQKAHLIFMLPHSVITVSIVTAPPQIIAELNILGATLWAMREAVLGLCVAPDHVLVDGKPQPVPVRLGVSDGTVTEVAGELAEGDASMLADLEATLRRAANQSTNA